MRQFKQLAAIVACSLLGGFMSFAQPVASQPVKVLSSMVPTVTKLQFDMQGLNLVEVNTPKGVAVIPTINAGVDIREKGYPQLPMVSNSIAISDTQDMVIEVISSKYTEQENVLVAPSKGAITRDQNPDLIPYEYGAEYSQNKFFPEEIATLADPFILRDVRGQSVMFSPVQYNPVTKTLRIYSEITVAVRESDKVSTVNVMPQTRAPFNAQFVPTYKRIFLNYEASRAVPAPAPEHFNGRMIVIAPDKFVDIVKPLVDWKNERGLETSIKRLSEIDASITATKIKNFIKAEYEKTDESPLTYVLLIGDAADLPALKKSGFDSDQAYGQLVGTDSFNEIFIGRLSAQTDDQLKTQVDRTIHYERNITTADDFLGKATGIASNEGAGYGDNGESDMQHMDVIRTALLAYGYTSVSQLYHTSSYVTPAQVAADINAGTSLMNYIGHGSDTSWVTSNFGNSHMSQLTNFNRLPFILSVACVNGNFVNRTCFAEAFLRSQKDGKPTGAVAMLASTMNQPWQAPMRGQDEMVNILLDKKPENIKKTFGGITTNGMYYMIDKYPQGGISGGPLTADTWTCFGDPSLEVRTKVATEMTISHSENISEENPTLIVNCDTEGAVAALSVTDEHELLVKAVVVDGKAELTVPMRYFESKEDEITSIRLTVTGFNKVAYQKLISTVTSIDEVASAYKVYGIESFIVADIDSAAKINVYDLSGRTVATKFAAEKTMIPVQAGTYLVVVETANGSRTAKVVVK